MEVVLFLVFLGVVVFFVIGSKTKAVITNDEFCQAGVTVNFNTGIIKIKGSEYSAADIRGIRLNGNKITITVSDLHSPNHTIRIPGATTSNAVEFYDRLSVAMEKVGCSFR